MAATMSILHRITLRSRAAAIALVSLAALAAFAITPAPAHAADDDLPSRVGRVALSSGAVYLAPEDRADAWGEVGQNYPVANGDNVWVSGEGRAEVDFGIAQLRLAGDTNVHVSRLDDHEFSLYVAQGRVIVRLRTLDPGDVARIDTPNTQVALLRPGLYRVDVSNDRQETTLVVREGQAAASVTGASQQVLPGQTATMFGAADVQADVRNGTGVDGFDTWSASRDRYYRASRTAAYVSPQMVGSADLDQYGSWESYPDYGAVWFPSAVDADWAPYRDGRWVTVGAWGLTWVDAAPWGYAPFHYGRWANVNGRWGWCPGRYVARPVWAPALVAWYGGNTWGAGAGGSVYGWVPLGWRDPYVPSWRNCSNRCWTNYNRPYAVNVAERPRQPPTAYANYRVPGAITAMSGAALVSGRPVATNRVDAPARFAGAAPLSAAPQVKPLPVATNVVRPGNGVPLPASNALGITKPLPLSRERNAAAAAPPGPAPTAAPPASGYNNLPRERFRSPETGQVVNRAEALRAAPPPAQASIPLSPRMIAPAPQPQPQVVAPPAPRVVAVPPQPQVQHVAPPPHAAAPVPVPADKPAVPKPQPANVPN
jgi:hypothetical protein